MTARLLVVDDEPDLRLLVELHLARQYGVVTVATGEEALEAVSEATFDAVLLDLRLPGIDGWQVLEHLRAQPATADVPVIVLTAHGSPGTEARCRAAGCSAFLNKPFTGDQLRSVVSSALGTAA
ncbi:MAG TPA: response regulator [Acidimicrobiia bacterium]|nr:response regulator [Acidimicrobiia bacterium]